MQRFHDRLAASAERAGSWLCVGLDPDPLHYPDMLEPEDTLEYCMGIVDAVADVACAVKPNAAYFEALGEIGHEALAQLVARMPPGLPVILDGKRNDIGPSAARYAEAAFEELGVDAVTVNAYLGRDTVEPFATFEGKGVFCLARTSNPSAGELQDLPTDDLGTPLWLAVTRRAVAWNKEWGNVGVVAGATYPEELRRMRAVCPDGMPLLVPGVGAQGADAAETIARAADSTGRFALVNVGRGIVRAGDGQDWRQQVAESARAFAAVLAPPRPSTA